MRRTCSRWRRPRMRIRSRQSARTVRTQRSACAFAFGAWTGVRIILMPSVRKTSSKAWLNFVSRSRIRKRIRSKRPVKLRLRACCRTQGPDGLVVQPVKWTRRFFEFDQEEDVDPLLEDGFDGEEVAGEHARRLRSQEGSPR